jgi:hypothetical protein
LSRTRLIADAVIARRGAAHGRGADDHDSARDKAVALGKIGGDLVVADGAVNGTRDQDVEARERRRVWSSADEVVGRDPFISARRGS